MAPKNWVLVTGTDSGFGSIVVTYLIEKGFGVFATHLLPDSAQNLRKHGAFIEPLLTDITKQESVDDMAKKIREKLGSYASDQAQLFGLINNAGLLFQSGPV